MPKVSVSEEVIASILTVLQNARGGLEEAVVDLKRAYFQAGADWNDKKYSQLGDIIERASRSILVIGSHLGNAREKVKKLQQAIVEYIKQKTSAIDEMIAKLKSQSEFLTEYKQRLIADVVTGQVKVD